MADVEEPQYNTLAERIAALNKQKNFNTSGPDVASAASRKRPPPPPPGKGLAAHNATPQVTNNGVNGNTGLSNGTHERPASKTPDPPRATPPPLPRRDTQPVVNSQPQGRPVPPPMPARPVTKTPQASVVKSNTPRLPLTRTKSSQSTASQESIKDGPRRLPPVNDTLPPLPPSRRESETQVPTYHPSKYGTRTTTSRRNFLLANSQPEPVKAVPAPVGRPDLPPRLPSRPANKKQDTVPDVATEREDRAPLKLPPHSVVPIKGFSRANQAQSDPVQDRPPLPGRISTSNSSVTGDDVPPPVPVSSRPSMVEIQAVSSRSTAKSHASVNDCWICRDWSGPDGVASQYPRQSLPRNDPVGYLAHELCHQFPSYTDKARAIFTWFHHNIFYDTKSFFGNCVRSMTVEETIFSGLAVCQGYADTYKAIANRAGLECIVVGGHGKGYGHTPLKKGERPPPAKPDGHAWNAVRIDGGGWNLIDACWGAGHLSGDDNTYKQEFSSGQFIWSNDKFGASHFPRDPKHQFRADGRTITWDEYFIGRVNGETPVFYTNGHQEGIAEDSLQPMERQVHVRGAEEVVRFQFSKICEHWTPEKNGLGKPPLFLFKVNGVNGGKDDITPMETNGYWHWIDVYARDLGNPGQTVQVLQLTMLDGRDARGVTAKEFLSKKGRTSMSWAGVICWDLV